jgi:Flp pilus assembly protein TadD
MTGRDIHQQGLQFFHENQYENAAKWLREALTLDPTAERWSDWASAELACGRTEQAEAGYRQALKLDLDNGEAALNLGALYATSGRAAEALGWLEGACSQRTRPSRNWPANFKSSAGVCWRPREQRQRSRAR